MLYFREEELKRLKAFAKANQKKALAVYGRRRAGKTALVLHFMEQPQGRDLIYFQCASLDYETCLADFTAVLKTYLPEDPILDSLRSFKDVITYFQQVSRKHHLIVIDEFPFLCKKNENAVFEFQWIIDHGLKHMKLILLGSNLSFMKRQINDKEAPLYGRFDEAMEILPFTFEEVHRLFPVFEDAVNVYAQTGGIAQYVMFFRNYKTVDDAIDDLFFHKDGRMFQEAGSVLMQELRDITTYVSILRAMAGGEKETTKIAQKAGLDVRGVFSYISKLTELGFVAPVENVLSDRKRDKRYRIADPLFYFNYCFIEPNVSMITAIGKQSRKVILDDRYNEYLGLVYEDIIRGNCFLYALRGVLPFMPQTVGKWWGNVMHEGTWAESEVDLVAYDAKHIVIGECKFRNKMSGRKELEALKEKAACIPVKGRKMYYLLASKSGFTKDLKNEDAILIHRV